MGQIRNDSVTYTFDFEDPKAQPIQNVNRAITIGGVVKTQADSERLEIMTTIRIKQSELPTINSILADFSEEIYYTPSCALYDRTTIEEIQVILTASPRITEQVWSGERIFYLELKMEEVKQL